jgi:CubicO group peptidase (beta-lactamase class C family)
MRRTRPARVNESEFADISLRNPEDLKREVKRKLEDYFDEDGPGVAVFVSVNDEIVLAEGYGKARIEEGGQKITPDTIFDLGSLSKHFTALGILMLIDQTTTGKHAETGGKYWKLSFGTRLRSIIPELPPWADNINIRNLLNHSSGILDYATLWLADDKIALWLKANNIDAEDFENAMNNATGYWYKTMPGYERVKDKEKYLTNHGMLELLSEQAESGEPRREWSYSNTGYAVLAEVIRRATGKSLREFLKEEVFDRLEMYDTFVYDDTVPEFKKHALCYRLPLDRNDRNYESIDSDTIFNYIHGDGNIHSTINDLAKWIKAWNEIDDPEKPDPKAKNPNRDLKEKLIKRTTFLKVYRPGLTHKWEGRRSARGERRGPRGIRNYASGMILYRYKNKNVNSYAIHHGGNWLGFNSYMMRGHVALYRQGSVYEVTILVLANYLPDYYDPRFPPELGKEIAELYWPLQGEDRYNVLKYI